jgi:hypothetical protein
MGLTILDHRPFPSNDEHGVAQVLYVARIFKKGENVSFVELADFLMEEGKRIRYRSGKTMDASPEKMKDPTKLTIELFAAMNRSPAE